MNLLRLIVFYLVCMLANGELMVNEWAGENVPEAHYLPFGLEMTGPWMGAGMADDTKYGYNGIEKVNDFDLNVKMAFYRTLDPVIGRWWQVDPKAESFASLSPYNSMGNNPLVYNDPNGDFILQAVGAVVGGTLNLASQALQGNVTSLGEGLAYFGVGAVAGVLATTGNLAAAKAVTVGGNKVVQIATGKWSPEELTTPGGILRTGLSVVGDLGLPAMTNSLAVPLAASLTPVVANTATAVSSTANGGGQFIKQALDDKAARELAELGIDYSAALSSPVNVTATKAATALPEGQLVYKAAVYAEKAVGGTGRFAGTAKHTYANNLLSRYQSIYGSRGLQFNSYFNNGVGNRGFLYVVNHGSKNIYDFKFGSATWRAGQFEKYARNFSGYNIFKITP